MWICFSFATDNQLIMTKSKFNVRWGPLVDAVIMIGKKEEVV